MTLISEVWRALVCDGVESATLGGPNDEAFSGHRLWHRGLSEALWMGIIEGSALRADLERQNSVHAGHDSEVGAGSVEVHRLDRETLDSAAAALRVA